jgi:protein-disulfide isomerase
MNRSIAALVLLAATACASKEAPAAFAGPVAASGSAPNVSKDPGAAMATVNGVVITAKEVDDQLKGQLTKMETEYVQRMYDMRKNAIEGMIAQKLTEAEAKKKGVAAEELFRKEVESRTKPPTSQELTAYYEAHKDQIPYPFEQIKERLSEMMFNEARQKAARDYLDGLRKTAKVEVLLQAPEVERVQVAADGPAKGPADAPITIVEFSDFQCPFCSRVLPTVQQVLAEYKGKVKFVYRDYPLSFHEDAPKAGEAGQCANEQGKFWEMHDKLYASQQQGLKVPDLKKYAGAIGLDQKKFDECLDSGRMAATVQKNMAAGEAAGVNGTPAFFINGVLISGAQPFQAFKDVIDRELKVAQK